MAYTTTQLLANINRRNFAPTGQTTYSTADILAIADEEFRTLLLPEILSVREEFFVDYVDYSLVASQGGYDIPDRAVGMIIREIKYYDASGLVTDLNRMEPEDLDHISQESSKPVSFYVQNNQIMLHRIPSSSSGTIRVWFFIRAGDLIKASSAAVVSAINTTTNVVTVSSIPSTWATADIFDLIKGTGGQEYLAFDSTSILVSGNDITFSSLPARLKVGDYVSPQEQSPLLQMPYEYRDVLAQATATFIMENMNIPGVDKAKAKLANMIVGARDLVVPRTQGSPRTVLPASWI